MLPTGKVAELPADVREELDALIAEKGFGDYAGLADWLSGRGHPMHKATVARHGKRLRRRIERMRDAGARAKALAAEAPPDFGVVADAALAEVQARLLDSLLEGDVGAPKDLAGSARAPRRNSAGGARPTLERLEGIQQPVRGRNSFVSRLQRLAALCFGFRVVCMAMAAKEVDRRGNLQFDRGVAPT